MKTLRATIPVFYGGRIYQPGDVIEAKEADAKALVDVCHCAEIEPEQPKPAPKPAATRKPAAAKKPAAPKA